MLRNDFDQLLFLACLAPLGKQYAYAAAILCQCLSKAVHICHNRGFIGLVCFEIGAALLRCLNHIGEVLSGIARHCIPYLKGSLPFFRHLAAPGRCESGRRHAQLFIEQLQ